MSVWQLWLIIGILFMVGEGMNAGTFALFFAGLGALVTSASCYFLPEHFEPSIANQLLLFSGCTVVSLILMRRTFMRFVGSKTRSEDADPVVGKRAKCMHPFTEESGMRGSVLFEGTEWTARLTELHFLEEGQELEIVGRQGLILIVRPAK